MEKILPYLRLALEKEASDLFFTTRSPVMVKVQGEFYAVGKQEMTRESIRQIVESILTAEQRAQLDRDRQIDFASEGGGLGRFRVNVFFQRGQLAIVMRLVKADVPQLKDLGTPPVLADLALRKRGLVLMVGATGSGKSTTLAAMVDHRNTNRTGHILTIEDPIEFLHPNRKSIVNQREIGTDAVSYAAALKSSLREAPDVILVGEIRDRETMEAAIQLAGTGHLCMATLHANNAYQTLQRIINMFPEDMRNTLYMDLAINLLGVVSQRLVRGQDGKRRAAMEVMVNTPFMSDLILKGEIDSLREAMADSSDKNMLTFDTSLLQLYRAGAISKDEALAHADSPANLETRIAFG
ncbi:MAG: PilT/PilU family type 4a pilus ATPase [Oceanococcaceae bacterium]